MRLLGVGYGLTATTGVDVGGTFTDVASWDGAALVTRKVPSTPDDQSRAVVAGIEPLAVAGRLLHGTTVATNALLERRGARAALVTTPGFEDVIEIGRQHRPSLYDPAADRPRPLIARDARFGVDDPAAVGRLDLGGYDAVAVSLMYGFARHDAEHAIASAIAAQWPAVAVSTGSAVSPEFREYERTATTVLNAFLVPETGRYLLSLRSRVGSLAGAEDVLVMRSSGGLIPVATAAGLPTAILLSGPAGGVRAAAALGEAHGRNHIISFDMGGTSTDVSRIVEGRPQISYERAIDGHPCRMPSIAINTVGAGGGSIAWVDPGGSLRVGPQSAGAVPGPVSYGGGGVDPTVTDANLALGRLPASTQLGGTLSLDGKAAMQALAGLGDEIGVDPFAAAQGVVRIVEEVMAGAIRTVSVQEGIDPGDATLVAFGGAGGLHASALARTLGMRSVLVPPHAGVFSALGLLLSPMRIDVAQSRFLTPQEPAALDEAVRDIIRAGRAAFHDQTRTHLDAVDVFVDTRYVGQSHEITVPYFGDGWAAVTERFAAMHRERNGFARPEDPIEIVTVRAEVTGHAQLAYEDLPRPPVTGTSLVGTTPVWMDGEHAAAALIRRSGLDLGDEVSGPAVVIEDEAASFIAGDERLEVLEDGSLEITW